MTTYHELDSQKYYTVALAKDHRSYRKERWALVGNMIVNCLLAISLSATMFIAISLMPQWLPVVETWFHEFTRYKYA